MVRNKLKCALQICVMIHNSKNNKINVYTNVCRLNLTNKTPQVLILCYCFFWSSLQDRPERQNKNKQAKTKREQTNKSKQNKQAKNKQTKQSKTNQNKKTKQNT